MYIFESLKTTLRLSSVDPDEAAHADLSCYQMQLFSLFAGLCIYI